MEKILRHKNKLIGVTFIMPVFNAAKFLTESIGGIINQSCPYWKLICVDDGSSDNSLSLLMEYMAKDERITVLTQKNQGPAVARANAIAMVETEYTSILDADDYVERCYVEKILEYTKRYDADIFMPNIKCVDNEGRVENSNHFQRNRISKDMLITDSMQAFQMSIDFTLHGCMVAKTMMMKKYYTNENAGYSKFNSDEYISRLLYLKSRKTVTCNCFYYYRNNPNSITRSFSEKHFDRLKTYGKLVDLCLQNNLDVKSLLLIYRRYRNCLFSMTSISMKNGNLAMSTVYDEYYNSYRKNISFRMLKNAGFSDVMKFGLSMMGMAVVKKLCFYR